MCHLELELLGVWHQVQNGFTAGITLIESTAKHKTSVWSRVDCDPARASYLASLSSIFSALIMICTPCHYSKYEPVSHYHFRHYNRGWVSIDISALDSAEVLVRGSRYIRVRDNYYFLRSKQGSGTNCHRFDWQRQVLMTLFFRFESTSIVAGPTSLPYILQTPKMRHGCS